MTLFCFRDYFREGSLRNLTAQRNPLRPAKNTRFTHSKSFHSKEEYTRRTRPPRASAQEISSSGICLGPGAQGEIILGALVRAGFLLRLFPSPTWGWPALVRVLRPPTRASALGAECRPPVALPRPALPGLTPSSLGRGAAHRAEDPLLPVLPL